MAEPASVSDERLRSMTTPEERIRAAVEAAMEGFVRDMKPTAWPEVRIAELVVGANVAGLCALLAELRAPREGETLPEGWWFNRAHHADGSYIDFVHGKFWGYPVDNPVSHGPFATLTEAIAAIDAHAAASKARGAQHVQPEAPPVARRHPARGWRHAADVRGASPSPV